MTFKPAIWQPIAILLSAVNLVAVGAAAGAAEPLHAAGHAGLAVVLGLWAQRLRRSPSGGGPGGAELQPRVETLEFEVGELRRELGEAQERLDFAERVLAKPPETRHMGPEA
jgi:hypothetical protein